MHHWALATEQTCPVNPPHPPIFSNIWLCYIFKTIHDGFESTHSCTHTHTQLCPLELSRSTRALGYTCESLLYDIGLKDSSVSSTFFPLFLVWGTVGGLTKLPSLYILDESTGCEMDPWEECIWRDWHIKKGFLWSHMLVLMWVSCGTSISVLPSYYIYGAAARWVHWLVKPWTIGIHMLWLN